MEFGNHPQKSGLFEFSRINHGIFLLIPIPTHPTSSQKTPFHFLPQFQPFRILQQLKLGNFAFFLLFHWISQLHSLIFPLPWLLLLEGSPCSTQEFPNSKLPNSSCPWQPLIVDGKSSLKFLSPPKSSNSISSQKDNQDFYGFLTSKLLLFPFFLIFFP